MRRLISTTVIAFALTACGNSSNESEKGSADAISSPSETPTASAPPSEPEGESTDCRLSATKYSDRAGRHALNFSTTAPAFGEEEELGALLDLQSEISVLCSPAVAGLADSIMVPLTKANYEIALCGLNPDPMFGGCRPGPNEKVHKLGERAASLVGELRNLIEA